MEVQKCCIEIEKIVFVVGLTAERAVWLQIVADFFMLTRWFIGFDLFNVVVLWRRLVDLVFTCIFFCAKIGQITEKLPYCKLMQSYLVLSR